MARRKTDSPQKAAMREMMHDYLKNNDISIKNGTDVNSVMRDMMSVLLEGVLDEELDEELGYSKYDYRNKDTDNIRNGHSKKTMHTSYGDMDVAVPRDRNGEYEPQLIKKYQNTVTQDMEEKILSMYAKGMTTGDIESHMRELYDIDISDSTVSRITDKILPVVREWQERPLEEVYAVVFMDAIHYHVRSEGRIVKRAVYIALGIDMNGKKDVLGMYVGENESAKFWLSIMNGLKNRGVEDILIACVDGLSGFPQAIDAVYPKTEIQQCIIHQIRNSTKFVSYKDIKKLMADLKRVYAAPTEEGAMDELELFKDKWDAKYPKIYKSWHDNWATLSTYFKYPEAVRRLIYTTNAIEGFNRQLRKVTKSKTVFPSDDSLLKMLYLAISQKNGRDTARIGDKSIPSWRYILKNVFLEGICNRNHVSQILIDMPGNPCIIQTRAEPEKSALPICNYSQILYRFFEFTQNLKRSRYYIFLQTQQLFFFHMSFYQFNYIHL